MKKILKPIGTVLLVLLLAGAVVWHFWSVRQLEGRIEANDSAYHSTIQFYSDSLTNVMEVVNNLGETIKFVRQENMSFEAAVSAGLIREEDLKEKLLKKAETITKLEERIVILEKPGVFEDPVVVDDSGCVKFPIVMTFGDKYYSLKVTADDPAPVMNSLEVFNFPEITVGWQKLPGVKNMFKAKSPVAVYENENPYAKATDMIHINIVEDKKWYETTGAKVGAGTLIGLTIAGLLFGGS